MYRGNGRSHRALWKHAETAGDRLRVTDDGLRATGHGRRATGHGSWMLLLRMPTPSGIARVTLSGANARPFLH